jgi:probable O-glycosylation ligase (exosortase A-associated)
VKGLIFIYALTYGGAAASLFSPFVGLLVYVAFGTIRPQALWHWSIPQGNYSRIVALALLIGWARTGFGDWRFGRGLGVVAALVGLLAWSALGTAMAADAEVAWKFVESLSKLAIPFVVGMTTVDSIRKAKLLTWVIVLSEGFVAYEMNLSYLQGFNRIKEVGLGDLDNNCLAIAFVTTSGLAFFLGLHARAWWQKAMAFGMAALMIHAVLLSFSRGGMLSLIVTGLVVFLLIPKRPIHFLVFALTVALCLRFAGQETRERFLTVFAGSEDRDASAQSRLDLWGNCWDAMLKRPVFGVGPDHFPLIVQEYGWPAGKEAHSLWLQIGAELGFPGLGCLILFYGLNILRLWPLTREGRSGPPPDPWFRDSARMVIASLAGFAVSSQFVSLEGLEVPYYVALVGACTLKLASPPGRRPAIR